MFSVGVHYHLFPFVGFSFPWHAGGNVWVCGGSVEKCWYTWRLQLQLTCTLKNVLFQSVNSGKRSVIRTLFFTIIHNGQIGLPQWFFFFFRSMLNPLSSAKLLLSPPPGHFNKSLLYMFWLFLVVVWNLELNLVRWHIVSSQGEVIREAIFRSELLLWLWAVDRVVERSFSLCWVHFMIIEICSNCRHGLEYPGYY